jgi:hypothetical protein
MFRTEYKGSLQDRFTDNSFKGSGKIHVGFEVPTPVVIGSIYFGIVLEGVKGSEGTGVAPSQQRSAYKGLVGIPKREETSRKP